MIKLSSQSDGMTPFLTMSLARSATNLAPVSPDAFSISTTIPEGPAALLVFILVIAFTTISTSICMGGGGGGGNNRVSSQVLRISRKLSIQKLLIVLFPSNFLGLVVKREVTRVISDTFVTNHILIVFSQLFCNFEDVVHPRF